jgi:sugar lactone lactonase YvrE
MSAEVECVWPLAAELGEGPMWSAAGQKLWFVDIKRNRIHSFAHPGGERRTYDTPESSAFVFEDAGGGMLCGLKSGLFRFDAATGGLERLVEVDAALPGNRLNDGFVDPAGRLWFGTMDDACEAPTGSLYRFSHGHLVAMDAGYVVTNGPAMSPDGRVLYHVDTVQRVVYAFDVDADGALANKREFVRINEPDAYPDGPVVDETGNVWLALFGGWGVHCYSPQGRLLRKIELPVARCTKVAFGGEDLRTLFITTARTGLSDADLAAQPLAGGLFRTRVDVAGLPQARFAG